MPIMILYTLLGIILGVGFANAILLVFCLKALKPYPKGSEGLYPSSSPPPPTPRSGGRKLEVWESRDFEIEQEKRNQEEEEKNALPHKI